MRWVQIAEFAWSGVGVSASAVPPPSATTRTTPPPRSRKASSDEHRLLSWFSGEAGR
jgi:hypothetical protein